MLVVAMMSGFYACSDWSTPKVDYTDNMKVYFVPSRNAPSTLNLYGICDTTISIAGVRYGGTQTPVGEMTVSLALGNASLVDAYNLSNGTEYKVFPEGVVTLLENMVTIPSHTFASSAFSVRINDNELLVSNQSYLLPVQMTRVEGVLSINENYTTAYVIVNRRPDTQKILAELEEHLKGQWTFDDSQSPQKATVGTDMVFGYGTGDGPYSNGDFTYDYSEVASIDGPSITNKAVSKPSYSFLRADHHIGANGGGQRVNEYSLLVDFRVSQGDWISLYQTDISNSNEADVWVKTDGSFFFYQDKNYGDPIDFVSDYLVSAFTPNQWHRVIVSVSLTNYVCSFYVDGRLVNNGKMINTDAFTIDGFLSLDPVSVLMGADGTAYDGAIDFSEVRIYDFEMNADHADVLGKVK